MPHAAIRPPPAAPLAAGATPRAAEPAPAQAAGAPCTSEATKASLTARARERVQAGGRSPIADVLLLNFERARDFTPPGRRTFRAPSTPLIASVFCASVSAMPSRDGAPATKEDSIKPCTICHHRLWLEGAPNQAIVSPSLPLLHHADLGYQVCGNGTRAVLSRGGPVWKHELDMERGKQLSLLRLQMTLYP